MEPRLLILETSGRAGAVALALGAELRGVRRLDEARRHARDLAPAVADLLRIEGWKPRDVNAVIVSQGPGSYTGLRVGIASAKTFAFVTGCGLVSVDTFALIAAQAPPQAEPLDIIADAQQDKIYVQRFTRSAADGTPAPLNPLSIRPFSEWLAEPGESAWVSGPGLVKVHDRIPAGRRVVAADLWDPRSESLLRLGLRRFGAGQLADVWSLEPIYLRPSSAEEKWTTKHTKDTKTDARE
jgi:tRNA threonylcarbamoyladenosine biosynthesis protein TsaB